MKYLLYSFLLLSQLSFADLSSDSNLTEKVKSTILSFLSSSTNTEENKTKTIVKPIISKDENKTYEEDFDTNEKMLAQKLLEEEHKKVIKRLEEEKKKKLLEKKKEEAKIEKLKQEAEARKVLLARIKMLVEEKEELDKKLIKDNIWANVYLNHERYQTLNRKLEEVNERISMYKSKAYLDKKDKALYEETLLQYQIIEGKLSQLKEYKDDPFVKLIETPTVGKAPTISNPLNIIEAMSFQKHLKLVREEYAKNYEKLNDAVTKLYEKNMILQELVLKTRGVKYDDYVEELRATESKLEDFELTLEILKTSVAAFDQKVSQVNLNLDDGIKKEIKKSIITGSTILFILLFFFFIKYLVKKYMSDNELFYGINKVINFLFIVLIFIILLFSYLENVGHLITVLSFASAGIAIALKDWFMSLIGWIVILVSGSIHVGDRVKFIKDGTAYVGDIVDISVLRMTLHEDVTLTTITENRRSGRIIFIPNNYIFTDMIANYSHSGLKTVWDGIDFMITFDSNVAKAQHIAKDVTRKYSKGYTDMTRKQLNRLRSKYSMRNTAVEPRILSFLDTYGVRISAWYLTNAYATLTLRSTISMEILSRLQEEDDIFMAFPSQSLYMDKPAPKVPLEEGEEPTSEHGLGGISKENKTKGWGVTY